MNVVRRKIGSSINKVLRRFGVEVVRGGGERSASTCTLACFGELNQDKTIYVIWREGGGAGFFSNVHHVLLHIRIADRYNWIPFIDMERYATLYNEDHPINDSMNAWDYYFNQSLSSKEVYSSARVVLCDGKYPYHMLDDWRKNQRDFLELYRRYVVPKEYVVRYVNDFCTAKFTGRRVLGVHWRGTDMVRYKHQPVRRQGKEVLALIHELRERFRIDLVFVATDEERHANMLLEAMPETVVFNHCYRSTDEAPIHYGDNANRGDHRFRMGLEVVQDMMILSKCDVLLCGTSNITALARLVNGGKYEHVEVFDQR